MKIINTQLKEVFQIENKIFEDNRGIFVKTFHSDTFNTNNLQTNFTECFYSTSKKNVLRGIHFQSEPHAHEKLVHVVHGKILDVVLDIQKDSPTFGQYISTILSSDNTKSLYISKGMAHGFLTLSESATVLYMTSISHSPEHDTGVKWNSFGFNWGIEDPIISKRDNAFKKLCDL